ncbi:hypothetical protein Ctob_005802 [Chrysochromulina tobinii]|uniref:PDZ domain-containing protein n=1 Tax=Chrysochromulina tobinii TaxID=1460289 RepID=A0A0M0J703_9EUKA|nr:hypothetical protein Ctob_005802 [Chrysochromulina tobinii]|eukprot:KOO22117.1 hypothetical protein Ctob_005802 [Chrysochromulina sp. CCMP291]
MLIKAVNGKTVGSANEVTEMLMAAFPEVKLLVFTPLPSEVAKGTASEERSTLGTESVDARVASMTAVQEQPEQTVSATGFEEVVLRKANKADVLGLVCNGRLVSDGTTEVVVQELKKGSIAEASVALKKGMLIKAVNGEPVGSAIDATAKMKAAFPEMSQNHNQRRIRQ